MGGVRVPLDSVIIEPANDIQVQDKRGLSHCDGGRPKVAQALLRRAEYSPLSRRYGDND